MAHVAKFTKAASGHMFKHYERAKDENGEYIKFGNQDIDPERSAQNYNLGPERDINQGDFVRQRCSEVYCFNRKNVNVMCSWIVTAPAEIAGSGNEREFFEKTYNFLADRYGADNVVSAYVHMDEITPHIHFAFVPVVPDAKRGLKVSAKERVNRVDLKSFHDDLDKHLEQTMGERYPGGIINGATKDGNKSIEELKRKSATERVQEANEKAAKMLQAAQAKVKALEGERDALRRELKVYTSVIGTVSEIEAIGKSTLGGKVTMTKDEAAKLKKQAAASYSAMSRARTAEERADALQQRYIGLEREVPKLRQTVRELRQERDEARKGQKVIADVIASSPELVDAYGKQADKLEAEAKAAEQERRQRRRGLDFDMGR